MQLRVKLQYNNTKIICFTFSAAEGRRAVLNASAYEELLGSDVLEKRMWMDRSTEWKVDKNMVFVPKALISYFNFGPTLSNQTKTAQERGSKTEKA